MHCPSACIAMEDVWCLHFTGVNLINVAFFRLLASVPHLRLRVEAAHARKQAGVTSPSAPYLFELCMCGDQPPSHVGAHLNRRWRTLMCAPA